MNYGLLKFADMVNGPGLRVTLFVSGCSNHCKGCHNPETHDPNFGEVFTDDTLNLIIRELSNDYYSGFTLCGGDPLFLSNRETVLYIARKIKQELPLKTIWMYTGYTTDEILSWHDPTTNELLKLIDVIIDGRYIESKQSLTKHWVGSANQRVMLVNHDQDGTVTFTELVD